MKENISRRAFVKNSSLAGIGSLSVAPIAATLQGNKSIDDLSISVFSKHLQFLSYDNMAEFAAEVGFNGVDLTVRPKGHVLPGQVKQDLPRAIESLKKVGFEPMLMTTSITTSNAPFTKDILQTAASLGIEYYRMGYYKFPKNIPISTYMLEVRQKMNALSVLNESLGINGAYQNHAGAAYVGASIWGLWDLLKEVNNTHLGSQYDIRHATVEGGQSWPTELRLIKPKINSIVLKDFIWKKENGAYNLINTPIGEGMVDFKEYFGLLKTYNINVPVSVHYEYDLGGAEHGDKEISIDHKVIHEAMKKDLIKIRDLWQSV